MSLLIDANLSPRLIARLSTRFPIAVHATQLGLQDDDFAIWLHAKENALVVLTQDADFQWLALVKPDAPKVIRVRLGNCSTTAVASLIENQWDAIEAFLNDAESKILVLP